MRRHVSFSVQIEVLDLNFGILFEWIELVHVIDDTCSRLWCVVSDW